jgi:acetylornithine deacetylase/succinyl-diaminopimelate desuccinylase-like protein
VIETSGRPDVRFRVLEMVDALVPELVGAVRDLIREFCRIEYSILYPPQGGAEPIQREIEAFVDGACRLDPWLREHPVRLTWNLDWAPADLDAAHPLAATLARARREALGETP